jgi:hypothetical protein
MKIINLYESPRKSKRYRVTMDNGKHYDFGLDTGSTYIDHHNPQKRLAYIARHLGNLSEKRLIDSLTPSPALFSMVLLWRPHADIESNIRYLNELLPL